MEKITYFTKLVSCRKQFCFRLMPIATVKRIFVKEKLYFMLTIAKVTRTNNRMKSKSAYFGQYVFSFFTAFVYHLVDDDSLVKHPVAVISESSDHSRIAVLTCIDIVVQDKFV